MSSGTDSELIALVRRVRDEAVLLLEELYHYYPELRPHQYNGRFAKLPQQEGSEPDATKNLKVFDFNGRWHDERGRFASLGKFAVSFPAAEAHLHKLLDANTDLSEKNNKEYRETISTVLANMPPAAHVKIFFGVNEIKAFNDVWDLRDYVEPDRPEHERKVMAAWNPVTRRLALNGGAEGVWDKDWEQRDLKRERVYAHELTHVIDTGHQPRISSTPAWKEAYDEEIRYSTDETLRYARYEKHRDEFPETAYREGFAEIGRLLYSGGDEQIAQNVKDISTRLPKCYAVFEEHQLIMKNRNSKGEDEKKVEVKIESEGASGLAPQNTEDVSINDLNKDISDGFVNEYGWHCDDFDCEMYPGLTPLDSDESLSSGDKKSKEPGEQEKPV